MGPWLTVSSDRFEKLGIEPATLDLQGKPFIHYTKAAPNACVLNDLLRLPKTDLGQGCSFHFITICMFLQQKLLTKVQTYRSVNLSKQSCSALIIMCSMCVSIELVQTYRSVNLSKQSCSALIIMCSMCVSIALVQTYRSVNLSKQSCSALIIMCSMCVSIE